MGDDPPFLVVGTEVSAKYKGAFCEAKIKKMNRSVKCKVTFKGPGLGTTFLQDEHIKGPLKVGGLVEAKHPTQSIFVEATINKIQDLSVYTVVFDDGDIATLKRSALCLKSGRHFNESESLDQLPLTHPEHFSNPVMGGRRGVIRRTPAPQVEDTSDDDDTPQRKRKRKGGVIPIEVGTVVCVDNTDKKKSKESWFPALVVSPSAQETAKIRPKDEFLVRSFRDSRYYTVPKKEIIAFTKDNPRIEGCTGLLKTAIDKAIAYMERNDLPSNWDRDILFTTDRNKKVEDVELVESSDGESDKDVVDEKEKFMAQLHKFMEAKGAPITKVPVVCNKELDLFKLYESVREKGGYAKVTGNNQWKPVIQNVGFGKMPSTSTITQIKQAYKKFLQDFEEDASKPVPISFPSIESPARARTGRTKVAREEVVVQQVKEVEIPVESKVPPIQPDLGVIEEPAKKPTSVETPRRSRSRQDNKPKSHDEEQNELTKPLVKEVIPDEPIATIPPDQMPTPKGTRSKGKRVVKEDSPVAEKPTQEKDVTEKEHVDQSVKISLGDRLRVYYGPKSDGKVTYEAKVIDTDEQKKLYLVHYTGWNTRYDEWISNFRISENLSLSLDAPSAPLIPQGRGPAPSLDSLGGHHSGIGKSGARNIRGKRHSPAPPENSNVRSRPAPVKKKRKSEDVHKGGDEDNMSGVAKARDTTPESTSPAKVGLRKNSSTPKEKSQSTHLDLEEVSTVEKELSDSMPDVYEFQDDLTETPRFKTLSPRSPAGKKEKEEGSKEGDPDQQPIQQINIHDDDDVLSKTSNQGALNLDIDTSRCTVAPKEKELESIDTRKGIKETRKGKHGSKKSVPQQLATPTKVDSQPASKNQALVSELVVAADNSHPSTSEKPVQPSGGLTSPSTFAVIVKESTSSYKGSNVPKERVIADTGSSFASSDVPDQELRSQTQSMTTIGERHTSLPVEGCPPIIMGKSYTPRNEKGASNKKPGLSRNSPADASTSKTKSPRKGVARTKKQQQKTPSVPAEQSVTNQVLEVEYRMEEQTARPIPAPREAEDSQLIFIKQETSGLGSSPSTAMAAALKSDAITSMLKDAVPLADKTLSDKISDNFESGAIVSPMEDLMKQGATAYSVDIRDEAEQTQHNKLAKQENEASKLTSQDHIVKAEYSVEDQELASIDASCGSLLCEEEIPKSPQPNENEAHSTIRAPEINLPIFKPEFVPDQNTTSTTSHRQEHAKVVVDATENSSLNENTKVEEEALNLYHVTSASETRPSGIGIDTTPPATPDSTNSGNVSSDFADCDTEKLYSGGRSKKRKLQSQEHSDTDSMDSAPRVRGDDFTYDVPDESEIPEHKSSSGSVVKAKRRNRSRKSDEYHLAGASEQRTPDEDWSEENDAGFTLTLPPMTIPKPPMTSKYYFIPDLGNELTPEERISVLTNSLHELKETYGSLKSMLSGIERKRKKIKKREKEKDAGEPLEHPAIVNEIPLSPTL